MNSDERYAYRLSRCKLSRRDALAHMLALLAVPPLAMGTDRDVTAITAAASQGFLTKAQLDILRCTAECIIPESDTPGAAAAGVHVFIDALLARSEVDTTRQTFVQLLQDIDDAARARYSMNMAGLDPGTQSLLIEDFDTRAFSDGGEDAPFRTLKQAVLLGYYTSEVGASVELGYNPIPGGYVPCRPLTEIGRAWYKH